MKSLEWASCALLLFIVLLGVCSAFEVLGEPSIDDYRAYLLEHGKDLGRLTNRRRFETFQRTTEFVATHVSSSYKVGLNELADWLPHEIPGSALTASSATTSAAASAYSLRGARRGFDNKNNDKIVVRQHDRETKIIRDARRYLALSLAQRKMRWEDSVLEFFGFAGSSDDENSGNNSYSEGSKGINWASEDNPFNVSIVGEVQNQGACGACWSFVAASAVEASVYMTSRAHLRLSAQELVDCDRIFNRGCEGGNPIYAFEYIMKYGLTNEHSYPYGERQHAFCRREQYVSRATIRSYVRLPPNNIDLIKQFLQVGPVATGICGTNSSFLYYTGGIYDPLACCQTQNHAVLIVGHGMDESTKREYFVIKNSWGEYWGDGGYMRLAMYPPAAPASNNMASYSPDSYTADETGRTSADTIIAEAGTCGVAMGPSLPTDGVLIPLYKGKQGSAKSDNNNSSTTYVDDDSYTDDGSGTSGNDDPYHKPGTVSWFWRTWNHVYFWYELNKTNYLFFFALSLFICSCGLCMYTLYEDYCTSEGINAHVYAETGTETEAALRVPLTSLQSRPAPRSPRSVTRVDKIR